MTVRRQEAKGKSLFLPTTSHQSLVTNPQSPITNHQSPKFHVTRFNSPTIRNSLSS
ncbi:MAG: hypothetical protein ACKPEO_12390 [Sphaerospermopsis kisseleviana]